MDTTFLSSQFTRSNILDFAHYHRTPDGNSSIEEIRRTPHQFFSPLADTDGTFYSGDDLFWVKAILKNETPSEKRLVLEVKNVRINELRFFSIRDGKISRSPLTGDYHPFSTRSIYHPFYLYRLDLLPGETCELYICYNKVGETITLDTYLWDYPTFQEKDQDKAFSYNLFLGVLVCITGATTLIALMSGRVLLLSFAIYCVSCLLMVFLVTGYGAMYLWPSTPYWNGLGYLFVAFYYLSLIQMTKLYLETKVIAPGLHRFFNLAQWLLILVYIPCILSYPFLSPFLKLLTGRSGLLLLFVITAGIIYTTIRAFRQAGTWSSLLFLLGFGFSILAVVLFEIEQFGSTNTIWNVKTTLFFILLDFIILGILFSRRIQRTFLRNAELRQELTQSRLFAANALLEGQLEERKRLSRQLHDGISIKMALLKMELSRLFDREDTAGQRTLESVSDISEDIRAFTHNISPFNLEDQSMEEAISDLLEGVESRTHLSIHLEASDFSEDQLSELEKDAIFQTLQELLNNTLKHAEASAVTIQIRNETTFHLTYCDNGKGIQADKIKNGIGLKNIRTRAQLLGGAFTHKSDASGSYFEFSF